MKGADKYYDLFGGKSQQIGRLFLQFHEHARGKCFEMFLLPEGMTVKGSNIGSRKEVVEVYGMTGGQRGWTETYGWLHQGKWQDDFARIVADKESEASIIKENRVHESASKNSREKQRVDDLLSSYA